MSVKYYYCDETLYLDIPDRDEYFIIKSTIDDCKISLVRYESIVYKIKYNRHVDGNSRYRSIRASLGKNSFSIYNKHYKKIITNLHGLLQMIPNEEFIGPIPSSKFIELMDNIAKYLDNMYEQYDDFIKVMNRSLFSSTKSSTN